MPMLFLAMLDNENDKYYFLKLHEKYRFFVFHVAKKFLRDETLAEEVASDVWFETAKHFRELSFTDDENN